MYHGVASFQKLAIRDVSRTYPGKTLNLVIYAKPTILAYSGDSGLLGKVDFDSIEPLVIPGVVVKAKKRE